MKRIAVHHINYKPFSICSKYPAILSFHIFHLLNCTGNITSVPSTVKNIPQYRKPNSATLSKAELIIQV